MFPLYQKLAERLNLNFLWIVEGFHFSLILLFSKYLGGGNYADSISAFSVKLS